MKFQRLRRFSCLINLFSFTVLEPDYQPLNNPINMTSLGFHISHMERAETRLWILLNEEQRGGPEITTSARQLEIEPFVYKLIRQSIPNIIS